MVRCVGGGRGGARGGAGGGGGGGRCRSCHLQNGLACSKRPMILSIASTPLAHAVMQIDKSKRSKGSTVIIMVSKDISRTFTPVHLAVATLTADIVSITRLEP